MGFPMIQAGLVPLWLITSTISLDRIRNVFFCFLDMLGIDLRRVNAAGEGRETTVRTSAEEQGQSTSNWEHVRSFPDEIRDSLTKVPVETVRCRFYCDEDAICAVCLCEYEGEDDVWLLPSCSHIFHKRCLDRWLDQNQTTCPTCRASLLSEELAQKHKKREEELIAELALWFSFYHGSTHMRSPWYRRHGFPHWIH